MFHTLMSQDIALFFQKILALSIYMTKGAVPVMATLRDYLEVVTGLELSLPKIYFSDLCLTDQIPGLCKK